MAKPILSIGLIVKNEERSLEKCLSALAPLRQAIPCELIIADTGSTDKTKEIASKYADILFDFTWVNDFSKARNAVMDKATGKWFMTVDADEYLIPDVTELVQFLNSTNKNYVLATTVIRNHQSKEMNTTYADFNALRIVRMDSGRRYSGEIHESLPCHDINEIYALKNTIFDHDGYANVSEEFAKNKEKRNLELLESKLAKEPDNLQVILQCLESSSKNIAKRQQFTKIAYETLLNTSKNNSRWDSVAAPCMRQAIIYATNDENPDLENMFNWIFKNFPKSNFTLIDTNYIYTKHLIKTEKYSDAIVAGKNYLSAIKNYKTKHTNNSLEDFITSLLYANESHESEITGLICVALAKTGKESECASFAKKANAERNPKVIQNIFYAASLFKNKSDAKKMIAEVTEKIISGYHSQDLDCQKSYESLLAIATSLFSVSPSNEDYKLFENVSDDFNAQIKILDCKTKKDAEKLLEKIENWEEFMPLTVKHALSLKADFPLRFFITPPSRLSKLTNALSMCAEELSDSLCEKYFTKEFCNNYPRASFSFNLLTTILLNTNIKLKNEMKNSFLNAFVDVAEQYLGYHYNPELLNDDKYIDCLAETHAFAWYLVKANKFKEENPLEYIKTLRTALNKVPQAKQIVEFLIEELQKEEESKKQEQIKNASPELVAMAEQLKVMLSAFPENSPELLAIKQSPMYKQVAFLIEN
ncbi:MAG: glycosyltransferase [Ruminococcaceae bacterium]|nr:glycosyltransferase [Oscillospiraceae bacterium]